MKAMQLPNLVSSIRLKIRGPAHDPENVDHARMK
jgi:hypothetical protein